MSKNRFKTCNETDDFFVSSNMNITDQLNFTNSTIEEYYLKKIQIYKEEYQEKISSLNDEIKNTQELLVATLRQNKEYKKQVNEITLKITFFKERLRNKEKNL